MHWKFVLHPAWTRNLKMLSDLSDRKLWNNLAHTHTQMWRSYKSFLGADIHLDELLKELQVVPWRRHSSGWTSNFITVTKHLKEEALGRTLWIIRFGSGYGAVARQQTITSNYIFLMRTRVFVSIKHYDGIWYSEYRPANHRQSLIYFA